MQRAIEKYGEFNGDFTVDNFIQTVYAVSDEVITVESSELVFALFDSDNNGLLDTKELRYVYKIL